jgi:hypothetical protein
MYNILEAEKWYSWPRNTPPPLQLLWVWDRAYDRPVLVKFDRNAGVWLQREIPLKGRDISHFRLMAVPPPPEGV